MWVVANLLGFYLIDDNGNVIKRALYNEQPSKEETIKGIQLLEKNEAPEPLRLLISELSENAQIKTDSEILASLIRRIRPNIVVDLVDRGAELAKIREILHQELVSTFGDYKAYILFANSVLVAVTKEKLRAVGEEPDKMIIQAITLIERLTESINAFSAHLREWYGIVFPDLSKIVDDQKLYARIIYELGKPENFTKDALLKITNSEKLTNKILDALKTAVIVHITDEDEKQIRSVAKLILDMFQLRDNLQKYLTELMEDTCPNITALVGPTIGAKLIRKAGGLRQLALKPASTIQVLGAEKALFRALRGKGTPPKHGIIFTHPLIFKAPWWQRGKIARALATKLAIAARVDYFSKAYIGDELKNELMMRVEEIRKKYPKPPPEKVKAKKKKKKRKKKAKKKRK